MWFNQYLKINKNVVKKLFNENILRKTFEGTEKLAKRNCLPGSL